MLVHRLRTVAAMAALAWTFADDEHRLAEEIVNYAEEQGVELHTHCAPQPPAEWDEAGLAAIQALHDQAGHQTFYAWNCWEEPCQALV